MHKLLIEKAIRTILHILADRDFYMSSLSHKAQNSSSHTSNSKAVKEWFERSATVTTDDDDDEQDDEATGSRITTHFTYVNKML